MTHNTYHAPRNTYYILYTSRHMPRMHNKKIISNKPHKFGIIRLLYYMFFCFIYHELCYLSHLPVCLQVCHVFHGMCHVI